MAKNNKPKLNLYKLTIQGICGEVEYYVVDTDPTSAQERLLNILKVKHDIDETYVKKIVLLGMDAKDSSGEYSFGLGRNLLIKE